MLENIVTNAVHRTQRKRAAETGANSLELVMKLFLCCLLSLGMSVSAWADVQIEFKDRSGVTSTMYSNGLKVRINSNRMPGYVLVDSTSGEFFMVDSKRREIIRTVPGGFAGGELDEKLVVNLRSRDGGEKIASYETGRFDLISNGLYCGTLYGSTKLMKNKDLRHLLEAMQSVHKMSRRMLNGMGELLSECQRATTHLVNLVDTGGFILRVIDEKEQLIFEVLSLDTDKDIAENYYDLPPGMPVVEMDEKTLKAMQQMNQLMKQMQKLIIQ